MRFLPDLLLNDRTRFDLHYHTTAERRWRHRRLGRYLSPVHFYHTPGLQVWTFTIPDRTLPQALPLVACYSTHTPTAYCWRDHHYTTTPAPLPHASATTAFRHPAAGAPTTTLHPSVFPTTAVRGPARRTRIPPVTTFTAANRLSVITHYLVDDGRADGQAVGTPRFSDWYGRTYRAGSFVDILRIKPTTGLDADFVHIPDGHTTPHLHLLPQFGLLGLDLAALPVPEPVYTPVAVGE